MSYLREITRGRVAAASLSALLALGLAAPSANATPLARGTDLSVDTAKDAPTAPVAAAATVARTRKSWNPHVSCRATVTTLRILLGKKRNTLGGATYRGGGFKPGIPHRRAFQPPCAVNGHPTFVQLNGVQIGFCDKINLDGDWTCTLVDPSTPAHRSLQMKSIHIETDKKFRHHSGWSKPPGGVLLNVQGFVFWDPDHTTKLWHHFTGWELHSFTAWRNAPTSKAVPSVSLNPRLCNTVI